MRSGAEIAAQIKKKMAETAKNEVIALSEEEFRQVASYGCPREINLTDWQHTNKCKYEIKTCVKCWKKATGRK